MNTQAQLAPRREASHEMTRGMIMLFAFCCGAIVANLYYAQPIIELIAPDIHMSSLMSGLIVSLTQIGYAIGLVFLVPLGDLFESRKLMIATAGLSIVSLASAAYVSHPNLFLVVSMLIGFSSVSVQMLIPLAAHLASEKSRGSVVGSIMSGLLLGILLSRPIASVVADQFGWRAVFGSAAVLMSMILLVVTLTIPARMPEHKASYARLLGSLWTLIATMSALRRRTFYQACMFATFSLFWTAVPIELTRHYGFSQSQIAIFALVGAIGAVAAPISGRLADAGHTRIATLAALAVGALSYAPALSGSALGLAGLVITGIVLDFCVQTNMVLGQREIFALDAHSRSRLNALYMTGMFLGGAAGSAAAGWLYNHGGWSSVAVAGASFPVLALAHFLVSKDK